MDKTQINRLLDTLNQRIGELDKNMKRALFSPGNEHFYWHLNGMKEAVKDTIELINTLENESHQNKEDEKIN